jgi:hypothetical protein
MDRKGSLAIPATLTIAVSPEVAEQARYMKQQLLLSYSTQLQSVALLFIYLYHLGCTYAIHTTCSLHSHTIARTEMNVDGQHLLECQ